jgi:hypothetical protein
LKGFNRDETLRQNQNRTDVEQQRRHPIVKRPPSPKPSTSKREVPDPLAKARLAWNAGIKEEYAEKFKRWSDLKEAAGNTSGKCSSLFIEFYLFRFNI